MISTGLGQRKAEAGDGDAPGCKAGPVLISGASGFIGSAVARAFLAEGFPVRALVRESRLPSDLSGVETVEADIRDPAAVAAAMEGMRFLVHTAADYRLWVPAPAEMFRTNVEGTRNVMEQAARAGIERIVHTSSVATIGLRAGGHPADESVEARPEDASGPYKRSKLLAEQLVGRMAQEEGLPAVIVNPSAPLGPGDTRPTPTGRMVLEAATGRMPAFVDTGLNFAHVDDIAVGHVAALQHGRVGERYILGGENVALATLLGEIAAMVGRRPPKLKLPIAPLVPLAAMAEAVARRSGRAPFITRDGLRLARRHMYFDSAKARRELGYGVRDYREGVRDALQWFRETGQLA